jgi:hypothetical protein
MKLSPLYANQTQIELNDGTVVFFSYKTPVAAFVPGTGYVRTNAKWSTTTTKHINKWLRGIIAGFVDQSYLDNLIGI